ncbi:MAG: VWA domain-containing protein [Deltaproteobacteria bacterium]|nr:VWA domain-containing protein [Deltaproteobacteria bacterium]
MGIRFTEGRSGGRFGLPLAIGLLAALAAAACSPGSDDSTGPRDVVDRADTAGDADVPIDVLPDTPPADDGTGAEDARPEVLPVDTDADGLSDDDEAILGTDPTLEDTDGDGFSDGVEHLAGTDPLNPDSFIPPTDYYVILPYEDPPQERELEFTARLGRGDVFFLVDTTGSMATAIANVRTSLSGVIVPALDAAIADVVMGVGDFRDFPVDPWGQAGDWTFTLRQTVTNDIGAVQSALDGLRVGGGGDTPEAQMEGLYDSSGGSCSTGSGFGAACFREDSHPIIVVVTDAPAHNGSDSINNYDGSVTARSWSETMATLNSHEVKILGAAVKIGIFPAEGRPDMEAAARATGSFNRAGDPTVYPATGGQVSDVVVGGIVDLVGAETQDVSARSLDEPADAVDATQFIKELHPVWASDATSFDDTTFYGVSGGTTVVFRIVFQNDFRPHETHVQIYLAYIEVFDTVGGTTLDRRNVYIVIPAEDGFLL